MTDNVILSTLYDIKYINNAVLANLQHTPLKLSRLIVLQETHLQLYKTNDPFLVPTHLISICQ